MLRTIEISDGIYIFAKHLEKAEISVNAFLVLDEKPSIIETGLMDMGSELAEKINEIIDISKVKYIFVTHEHLDHIGGLSDLVAAAYNARVVVHKYIGAHVAFMGVYGVVDLVNGGEKIRLGHREIDIVYAPIETHGYIFFILWPDKIIFTGDYFGQLSPDKWYPYSTLETDDVISEIVRFHEGLGYKKEDVKKYLSFLRKVDVAMIAPSHGSIINRDTKEVVSRVIEHKLKPKEKWSLLARIFGRRR